MKQFRHLRVLTAALALLAAAQVGAVPVTPGGAPVVLPGTTAAAQPELAGVVLEDVVTAWASPINPMYGFPGATGTLQSRVVRETSTGTLDFYWRLMSSTLVPIRHTDAADDHGTGPGQLPDRCLVRCQLPARRPWHVGPGQCVLREPGVVHVRDEPHDLRPAEFVVLPAAAFECNRLRSERVRNLRRHDRLDIRAGRGRSRTVGLSVDGDWSGGHRLAVRRPSCECAIGRPPGCLVRLTIVDIPEPRAPSRRPVRDRYECGDADHHSMLPRDGPGHEYRESLHAEVRRQPLPLAEVCAHRPDLDVRACAAVLAGREEPPRRARRRSVGTVGCRAGRCGVGSGSGNADAPRSGGALARR